MGDSGPTGGIHSRRAGGGFKGVRRSTPLLTQDELLAQERPPLACRRMPEAPVRRGPNTARLLAWTRILLGTDE